MIDLTITSLETIDAFELNTGKFLFELDELQNCSLAQGQEKVDITGKQGRKLSSLKRNKTFTISGANGMVSCGLLEMQTGGTFENKAAEIKFNDYLTVDSNEATTSYVAIGTSGAEIIELHVLASDGTSVTQLTQDSAAASGKFAYNPGTKKLTFSGIADGTEIVCIYKRKVVADVMSNDSDVYSKKCELYVDAIGEDKCANVYRVQFHIPKADFNGEFTLDLGDDQTVHNFEAEGLAGACGAGGKLWDVAVFGESAPDYTGP